jgi:citrate synthase
MENTAKLNVNDVTYELPVIKGSEGEIGVDISTLRSQSGVITLDKGFKNTGSTKSAITFLNGEAHK